MPKHSQRHGNYGKSVHANINVDCNTHFDAFEDVYVPGAFQNTDTIGTIWWLLYAQCYL